MILPDGIVKEGLFECNVYKGPLGGTRSNNIKPWTTASSSSLSKSASAGADRTHSSSFKSDPKEVSPHNNNNRLY
jgi:hypothetical protein